MPVGKRPKSLVRRYLGLAVLIVVLTTVFMGATMVYGVLGTLRAEEQARQQAYAEVIQRDIFGTLQASQRVVRAASDRSLFDGEDQAAIARALSSTLYGNAAYLSRIAVIETSGTVVAASPPGSATDADEMTALAQTMRAADASPFVWLSTENGQGALWTGVTLPRMGGATRLLVADVRLDPVADALESVTFSDPAAAAFLVDWGTGELVAATGNTAVYESEMREYSESSEDPTDGTVGITVRPDEAYSGVYGQVPGLGTLDWRVVVVEPRARALGETIRALGPAGIVWAVAVLAVLAVTVSSFAVLLRPLRELEQRTAAVASGASVGSVDVRRDDEVGRLWRSFNSLTTRMSQLRDTAQLLAGSYDRETVLDGIMTSLSRVLDGGDALVLVLSDDDQTATVARAGGSARRSVGTTMALAESPALQTAISTGDSVSVNPETTVSDALVGMVTGPLRRPGTGLVVPLMKGVRRLGALAVFPPSRKPAARGDEVLDVVRSFAPQASIALDNARLFAEERISREQAEALRQAAEILTRPKDLRGALDEAAGVAASLLGFDGGAVLLTDIDALGARSSDHREAEALCAAALDEDAAVRHDQPRWWRLTDEDSAVGRCLNALGARDALASPLSHASGRAGALVLWSEAARGELSARQESIVRTIATEASLAIENAYLLQRAKNRADNLETIFRISQAVSSSLQTRVVLNRVLDVVQKIFSADAVLLLSYDPARGVMTVPMARGLIDPAMIAMEFGPGVDIPGQVFERRAPLRIDDLSAYDSPLAEAARSQGLGSALAVPLLVRGRSIGVLCVFSREGAAFPKEDLELLSTFAVQAALAIDNAQLYGREHHVATVLQRSIRPTTLPDLPGVEAASVYVPGGGAAEIGGDYYDLFATADGRVVVAIGDVCGSGVEAATKTSMLRYSVRSMIAAGLGPGAVLGEINRMITEGGDPSDIVTLWVGILDPAAGTLTWADGGHPPGLLLTPDRRRIERLGPTGALLGAVASAAYTEEQVRVAVGSTLLLYTDGVTEARADGEFFGEGRVRRALKQAGTPGEVAERLLGSVERFARAGMHDDVAIVTLRVTEHDFADGAGFRGADSGESSTVTEE